MDYNDLLMFCGDDFRYNLSLPWLERGWVYATNGFIIARLPAGDGADRFTPPPETKHPDTLAIKWNHEHFSKWSELPPNDFHRQLRALSGGGITQDGYYYDEDLMGYAEPEVEDEKIDGLFFSKAHLFLLSLLPDCVVASDPENTLLMFKFGNGGQGIIMSRVYGEEPDDD